MRVTRLQFSHFFGFDNFVLDLDELTILVGPNNGGKTTALRAIKFALDAVKQTFGNNEHNVRGLKGRGKPTCDLASVAQRSAISELNQLFFRKDRAKESAVSLSLLEADEFQVDLTVQCDKAHNNVFLSIGRNGAAIAQEPTEDSIEAYLRIFRTEAEFVPAPGTMSGSEDVLNFEALQNNLAQGRFAETWRNQIQWKNEGKEPEFFQRVVDRVRDYLPDVGLRPPARSRSSNKVDFNYGEGGAVLDISAAGAGMRTLITLAGAIELSEASILLFDEPDSHLHPNIQRQAARLLADSASSGRQILVSTHCPEFIEEVPLNSLVWIDRYSQAATRCDEVGKVLVDLGVVNRSRVLQHQGANAIIYFEAVPDRRAFEYVLTNAGKANLLRKVRVEKLKGSGQLTKLPALSSLLNALDNTRVKIAAIVDADYLSDNPLGTVEKDDGLLVIRLPCKELENLLLLSPECVIEAVQAEAERRLQQRPDPAFVLPTVEELVKQIDSLTRLKENADTLKHQWMAGWIEKQDRARIDGGVLRQAEDEFLTLWENAQWRTRWSPGKEVLKGVRRWLKDTFKTNLSLPACFQRYKPSPEIQTLFDALEQHVVG